VKKINFWLNVIIYVLLTCLLLTGLFLRYTMPPGSGEKGLEFLGLGRHDWGAVHFWIAVALLVGVAFHLYLHWAWIRVTTPRYWGLAWRAVLLVFLLLVILALLLPFFIQPVKNAQRAEEHKSEVGILIEQGDMLSGNPRSSAGL